MSLGEKIKALAASLLFILIFTALAAAIERWMP